MSGAALESSHSGWRFVAVVTGRHSIVWIRESSWNHIVESMATAKPCGMCVPVPCTYSSQQYFRIDKTIRHVYTRMHSEI